MISEQLRVDLAQITSQLQQLQGQARENDARTASAQRRIQEVTRTVSSMDKVVDRLLAKVKSQAKSLLKGAAAQGFGSVLDSLDLGDDPFANYTKNILSSTVAGAAFGGLPGAGLAAATAAIGGLKGMIDDTNRRLEQLAQDKRNRDADFEESISRIALEARKDLEELRFQIRQEAEESRKNTDELIYQSGRYAEYE